MVISKMETIPFKQSQSCESVENICRESSYSLVEPQLFYSERLSPKIAEVVGSQHKKERAVSSPVSIVNFSDVLISNLGAIQGKDGKVGRSQ